MVYIEIGLKCARRVGCNVAGQTVASKRHIWNMFNRATALGAHQRLVSYVERLKIVVELKRKDLVTAVLNHMSSREV